MADDNYIHLHSGAGWMGVVGPLKFIQFVLFRQQRKIVQSKTNVPFVRRRHFRNETENENGNENDNDNADDDKDDDAWRARDWEAFPHKKDKEADGTVGKCVLLTFQHDVLGFWGLP